MSVGNSEGSAKNLFDFEQSQTDAETDNPLIREKITRELEAYQARQTDGKDSTNGISASCHQFPTQYKKNLTN